MLNKFYLNLYIIKQLRNYISQIGLDKSKKQSKAFIRPDIEKGLYIVLIGISTSRLITCKNINKL